MNRMKSFNDFSHLRKDIYKDFGSTNREINEIEVLRHIENFIIENKIDGHRKCRHGKE